MGAKGEPKTPGSGRKPGTPNKYSNSLKDDILSAAALAHKEGRVAYLKECAITNVPAFLSLLGKILPTDMTVKSTVSMRQPREFSSSADAATAAERYARALRGEFDEPSTLN